MTISFRKRAGWIVKRRTRRGGHDGQPETWGEWERVSSYESLDSARRRASDEKALMPLNGSDVGIFRRGQRVWP